MPEIKIENCRLVNGHPMKRNQVLDKVTKQPAKNPDGTPKTDCYFGVAVPKTPGVDWKQEPWGAVMVQEAAAGWPAGESLAPTFSWKVVDGDSLVPNRKGKVPATRPGYPGHWILNCSTYFFVKCYHVDKYDPMEQIQNPLEIKPGDYCKVLIGVKHNNPAESPGVYLNPELFVLVRPGEAIILDSGTTAAEAFGGGAPAQQPAAQQPAPTQPAATGAPVQPAPDFLNPQGGAAPGPPAPPVENFSYNGVVYTREQLEASKWTPEAINALPRA